jgi:hypothetical protein
MPGSEYSEVGSSHSNPPAWRGESLCGGDDNLWGVRKA